MIGQQTLHGTLSFTPAENTWTSSGNGWHIESSEKNSARVVFAEPLAYDEKNELAKENYSVVATNVGGTGSLVVEQTDRLGFTVTWEAFDDRPCRAAFTVKGMNDCVVPDDRALSDGESVADVNAASLVFNYEAKYGVVSVMGSASIQSRQQTETAISGLQSQLADLREQLEKAPEPQKPAIRAAIADAEAKLVRQRNILANGTRYWDSARRFGQLWGNYAANEQKEVLGGCYVPICTGGGPGIMQAVAEGARAENAQVIGIDCQFGNDDFHNLRDNYAIYSNVRLRMNNFSIREGCLINYSNVILFWPGGYGTGWEVCETLSKIQTQRLRKRRIKAIFVDQEFWQPYFALVDNMRKYGTVNNTTDRIKIPGVDDQLPDDMYIAEVVNSPEEAFSKARSFVEGLYARNELTLREA